MYLWDTMQALTCTVPQKYYGYALYNKVSINLKHYLEHQREDPRSNYRMSRPSLPLLAPNTVALQAYMAAREFEGSKLLRIDLQIPDTWTFKLLDLSTYVPGVFLVISSIKTRTRTDHLGRENDTKLPRNGVSVVYRICVVLPCRPIR